MTELRTGLLKALRINSMAMRRRFYLIRDKQRVPSPLCNNMIEFLMSSLQGAGK